MAGALMEKGHRGSLGLVLLVQRNGRGRSRGSVKRVAEAFRVDRRRRYLMVTNSPDDLGHSLVLDSRHRRLLRLVYLVGRQVSRVAAMAGQGLGPVKGWTGRRVVEQDKVLRQIVVLMIVVLGCGRQAGS